MRVKGGIVARRRRKEVLRRAKGFFGATHRRFRAAKEAVIHAERYQYIHRRTKKRDFRGIWITRINAATRQNGMTYSRFIAGLAKAGFATDRKILAKIAIEDPNGFTQLVELAKTSLS